VGQRILDLQDQLIAAGEELLYRATHDNLTGMVNRGVLMDTLRRERARQVREEGSFGIVLVDLDHFKYVHDTFSHLAGDDVLREVAQRMMACVRPYDSVGRYDGEEFLIVVPSADAMGTMELAERIRRSIEAKPMMADSIPIAVTASFGVTASVDKSPLDAQGILRLADAALYRATERGRNRTELARPEDLVARATDFPDTVSRKRRLARKLAGAFGAEICSCETGSQPRFSVWRGASRLWHDSFFRFGILCVRCAREGLRGRYGAAECVRRHFED
jgi:diguanylate cyclase (GGDEF)-like protein